MFLQILQPRTFILGPKALHFLVYFSFWACAKVVGWYAFTNLAEAYIYILGSPKCNNFVMFSWYFDDSWLPK